MHMLTLTRCRTELFFVSLTVAGSIKADAKAKAASMGLQHGGLEHQKHRRSIERQTH